MGYGQSGTDQAQTQALTGQVNQNLSQFNSPPGGSALNTPYGQSLLQTGTTSTNQAYDNASRNLKASMQSAGVAGASGAATGNNAAMGAQRATALGQVGTGATQGATQMQQQANAEQLQEAGMYSGAGLGYYSGANQAEQNQLNSQASMWNGLMQAGVGLGEAAILA
jgi:hypothetical protein